MGGMKRNSVIKAIRTVRAELDEDAGKELAEFFKKNPRIKKMHWYSDAIREKLSREEAAEAHR